ncbi:hypothetical protein [Nonomuraea sp. NPDC049750]|uniref:hypothetical protein n=1 Tax=Nonomuraea sp. NPDC049750 TaxID=3154738 RepID=UPI0033E1D442
MENSVLCAIQDDSARLHGVSAEHLQVLADTDAELPPIALPGHGDLIDAPGRRQGDTGAMTRTRVTGNRREVEVMKSEP